MEQLEEKITALIERLEEIKERSNFNIDSLKEQIDIIENEEYPRLENEYLKLKERDDILEFPLEYIEDRLLYTNALINIIYEKFGFEYADDEEYVDELIRAPLEDKEDCTDACDILY